MQTEALWNALKEVIDPEIGINVVDLGLIYDIEMLADRVQLTMTLTSPACPMGAQVKEECEAALAAVVESALPVVVELVWEPPWTPERMSERAQRALGVK